MEEGASTITQQLARTVFLSQDRTIIRKLKEALLAGKLERQLSKQQILEQYLNYVYLGSSAYGVSMRPGSTSPSGLQSSPCLKQH